MKRSVYVFDAYGTLFDVHAAIARHREACGPDADRLSELWRTKQLEYSWTLTLAGRYEDFWTPPAARSTMRLHASRGFRPRSGSACSTPISNSTLLRIRRPALPR